MTLDVESLNLKDALDLTVLIEEDARDRYVELAGQLRIHHNAAAAGFFEKMAKAEEQHRTQLLARRTALFGDTPVTVQRDAFFETEPRHFDDARVKMTIDEALEEALNAEDAAKATFDQLLLRVKDPEVTALFCELRDEEVEHRELVLQQLTAPRPARRPAHPSAARAGR
jgi:rubrerythrin